MNRYMFFNKVLFLVGVVMISACSSSSNNWPQFRGSDQNTIQQDVVLPVEWGDKQNILWAYELNGVSWSSPIIWENRVFITTSVAEKNISGGGTGIFTPRPQPSPVTNDSTRQGRISQPPNTSDEPDISYHNDVFRWELTCLDLTTGQVLWAQVAKTGNPRIKTHVGNTYASETPVTDGKRVYVYFGMTGVFCYDMGGKLIWQKDLGAYETQKGWGTGASPLIFEDLLYIQVDNEVISFIVALNAENGEEVWRINRDEKTTYSTPVIWKNTLRTELVTSGKTARSYNPKTGALLWELELGGEMSIPSAVSDKDYLYIGNAGGREKTGTLWAVKKGAEGDITPANGETTSSGVEWAVLDAGTGNPSPLLYKDLIYILGSSGELRCYEALTGKLKYNEKVKRVRACWASPWAYKDMIFILDDKGITHIIRAGEKYELISQNDLDDTFWASPAISSNSYVFKGLRQLYCIGTL